MIHPTASRRAFLRPWLIWTAGFLAFPLAGLAGTAVAGRLDSPLAALLGGAVIGLVFGVAQAIALPRHTQAALGLGRRAASAVGPGLGRHPPSRSWRRSTSSSPSSARAAQ